MRNRNIIKYINIYKKNHDPNNKKCRFYPTCSTYALETYKKFNFLKATYLTIKRLLKCNIFTPMGTYDPVKEESKYKHKYPTLDESLVSERIKLAK